MARRLDQIIVIDVESTCWQGRPPEGQQAEIIEVGVCSVDVATGQRLERQSLLVRPEHSTVSEYCTALTTLTQEQVEGGVPFAVACAILQHHYLCDERSWASYGDYDRRMFEEQCRARGIEFPFGPTHINLKNLLAIASGWPRELGTAEALQTLGIAFEGTEHRGVDDAWNIAGILTYLLLKCRIEHGE